MAKPISKQKRNKILALAPEWMEGKLTYYEVNKRAGVKNYRTTKAYLHEYAKLIKEREAEIVEKLTEPDMKEEGVSIWQKIKRKILSLMLKG